MPFRMTHYTRSSLVLLRCWQWLLMWLCAGFACSVQASHGLPAFELAKPAYQYDALGRTIRHTSPLGSFEQSYLGETGQLTAQTLSGTANNNIISQIQETGPAAVPKQTKSWSYTYDAASSGVTGFLPSCASIMARWKPSNTVSPMRLRISTKSDEVKGSAD